jgi:tRNA-specific adenosine deaminase 2
MDAPGYGDGMHPHSHRKNTCAHIQAEEALAASEVPVGCVFVRDGKAIARARNRTNELRNVYRCISFQTFRSLMPNYDAGYPPC